jgi:hypothetical protein
MPTVGCTEQLNDMSSLSNCLNQQHLTRAKCTPGMSYVLVHKVILYFCTGFFQVANVGIKLPELDVYLVVTTDQGWYRVFTDRCIELSWHLFQNRLSHLYSEMHGRRHGRGVMTRLVWERDGGHFLSDLSGSHKMSKKAFRITLIS